MKKVFCFGVFDGIHDGHIHMLNEARSYGDYLVVAVTQDHIVEQLKNRQTRKKLTERIVDLVQTGLVDEVLPGDEVIATWYTLQKVKPAIIALGYDQQKLKQALEQVVRSFDFPVQIVELKGYQSDRLHSSLLFSQT